MEPFLRSAQTHGLVQFFDRQPGAAAELTRLGVTVHGFQRNDAYYVTVPKRVSAAQLRSIGVRAAFALRPDDKIGPLPRSIAKHEDPVDVFVSFAADTSRAEIIATLSALGGAFVRFGMPSLVLARVPPRALRTLASRDSVWWIEASLGASVSLLDDVRAAVRVEEVLAAPWGTGVPGFTGTGVNVGIWEVDGVPQFDHPDFDDPIIGPRVFEGEPSNLGVDDHATGVTGVLIGNGAASEGAGGSPVQWAGIAPEAVAFAYQRALVDIIGDEVTASHVDDGILVTNHSYGSPVEGPQHCAGVGNYGTYSLSLDEATNVVPVTAVHGAGNEAMAVATVGCQIFIFAPGGAFPLDPMLVEAGFGTINGLATSKNSIAVGGRAKDLDLSPASSRGPTFDGRLKPDISAIGGIPEDPLTVPGPPSTYIPFDGTSFAAPQVAGGAALLIERYREIENDPAFVPSPAVVKAALLNTTQRTAGDGPTYTFGYGILDLEAAIGSAENFQVVTVIDGGQESVSIPAGPPDACELRVMATWTDPTAMLPSGNALVNDIDLQLIVPEDVVLPWTLDPAQPLSNASRNENHVDNVEQVTVAPPPGSSEAIVGGDSPMGGGQEVVVHWYYAACDNGGDGGTGTDEGDGGDGTGCPGCSTSPFSSPVASLGWILVLGSLRRRRRGRHPIELAC
ncbi:MAG: S8 family serine peptidase [Myxococcota bacterium]